MIRYNINNEINFAINEANGNLEVETEGQKIVIDCLLAQELLVTLRQKQLVSLENQKDNWLKKLFF